MSPSPNASAPTCSLPCIDISDPMRSFACLRVSVSVVSVVIVPLITRKTLIRPGERVGDRLEDERGRVRALELDLAALLRRARHALDEQVEERGRAEVLGRDRGRDREDLAARDGVLERLRDLLVGELLAVEVALHQPLVGLDDGVEQLLPVLGRLVGQLGGDLGAARSSRCPSGLMYAHMCRTSTIPVSSCSAPIGMCTATQRVGELARERLERAEEVGALAVEHVDDHDTRRASRPRRDARPRPVPTSTPITPLITTSAPSTTRSAAIASPWKPASPGASIRLILRPCQSTCASDAESDICRRCSSSSWSETVVPASTVPSRLTAPDWKSRASTRDVLPVPGGRLQQRCGSFRAPEQACARDSSLEAWVVRTILARGNGLRLAAGGKRAVGASSHGVAWSRSNVSRASARNGAASVSRAWRSSHSPCSSRHDGEVEGKSRARSSAAAGEVASAQGRRPRGGRGSDAPARRERRAEAGREARRRA